jgi:hypothetical protein
MNSPAPARSLVPTDTVELRAGGAFACARRNAGTVSCWGDNFSGQLGTGNRTMTASIVNAGGLTNVRGIELGNDYACARTSGFDTVCWGNNADQRAGDLRGLGFLLTPATVFGL